MAVITAVHARQILDSRGNPTVEVAIYAENAIEHPVWAKNGMVASQETIEDRKSVV